MICVTELRREYNSSRGTPLVALDDISFHVPQQQIVALLGHNGAGKTTLTKILATMLLPSGGDVTINGIDICTHPRRAQPEIGVVLGGDKGLYNKLSARDNLTFFATISGRTPRNLTAEVTEALHHVGLSDAADRRVETFSKGMRQRLQLAIGMFGNPKVLLLDEPTVGLDPVEAEKFRQRIHALRQRNVTVLLTSHQLLDVERLAERVLYLKNGKIVLDCSMSDFKDRARYVATLTVHRQGHAPGVEDLRITHWQVTDQCSPHVIRLGLPTWSDQAALEHAQVISTYGPENVVLAPASLDDVYCELAS